VEYEFKPKIDLDGDYYIPPYNKGDMGVSEGNYVMWYKEIMYLCEGWGCTPNQLCKWLDAEGFFIDPEQAITYREGWKEAQKFVEAA
jgi:hypothetical protein|tara:strand:- start:351 stop:611 length:261 start_codon:yes stop_codon:yes gene_type:complete